MKQKKVKSLFFFSFAFLFLFFLSLISAFNFESDEFTVTTTTITYTTNITNLSELGDTNIPTPGDVEVLTWNDTSKRWESQSAAAVGDTNESTRVITMLGTDCDDGNYSYGHDGSGNILCRDEPAGGSGNGNTSAEIIAAVNISADYEFTANDSIYWANMSAINETQMENSDGLLNILESWLTSFIDSWLKNN